MSETYKFQVERAAVKEEEGSRMYSCIKNSMAPPRCARFRYWWFVGLVGVKASVNNA